MSAIGPGSIVQAVRDKTAGGTQVSITDGALYRVEKFWKQTATCEFCKSNHSGGVQLYGQQHYDTGRGRHFGFCACNFRPWPPEPPAELRSEPVDQDEQVPA